MGETKISAASPYILFIMILACVEAVVVVVGFYHFRNIQPLRARPLRVVGLLVLVLAANISKYYLNVAGKDDCFRDIWIEAIIGGLSVTAFFFLAFRLFVIYSITKNRLEDKILEGEVKLHHNLLVIYLSRTKKNLRDYRLFSNQILPTNEPSLYCGLVGL
jgi:hypothetical protein